MSFNYILIAFSTLGYPPHCATIQNTRKDYFFAPLCHDGLICTADFDLWSKSDTVPDSESRVFCPQEQDILNALLRTQNEGWRFLMALTERHEFDTPGSPSVCLSLELASNLIRETKAVGLIELGFDVVDQWTGLSALANVGYSADDVKALIKLKLKTNQFGLFDNIDDGFKFAEFAIGAVPEHAPFLPIKIVCSPSVLKEG
jgi:hypothetical protein